MSEGSTSLLGQGVESITGDLSIEAQCLVTG